MDFFLHYRNPNCHSSSSSSSIVVNNNNNNNNTFHGRSEVEKKKRKNKKMVSNKVKLSTDPQSVAARERRHRISERFKILRSLIPGGDTRNMDTVSMLEEVIQYVKFLKTQIWLHQTMISFENFDEYDNNINAAINKNHHDHDHDQYPHQDLPFDHIYDDYHHLSSFPQMDYEMLPQLGFEEGSCFKVEGEDNIGSLSHDHHHHVIYP